jgi:hypothetical protein
VKTVDETDFGFGWVDETGSVPRTSHALVAGGRVWAIDPVLVDGLEERLRALGEPAAVLVLLDRHRRDSDALAERLGVPIRETPFDGVPDAPFSFRPILRLPFWREVALWWPERRVLVAADALGTLDYMTAGGEKLGIHPLVRPWPPRRSLAGLDPEHVLVGHGAGVHGPDAAEALDDALAHARVRILTLAGDGFRAALRRLR